MVDCPRYDAGFETLHERDEHVRSHDRPSKCPERGCFYGEIGFPNDRNLSRHISLCHADPAPDKFIFPKLSSSKLPTVVERTKFREAIEQEDLGLIRDLIRTNGSLKYHLTLDGYTGLHHAAKHGKKQSAQILLDCGSNIGAVGKSGTALNLACYWGQTAMVQFLLLNSRRKEDVNSKDSKGKNPLASIAKPSHVAARLEIVRLLLEDGRVFADSKNHDGRTPLSLAAVNKGSDVAKVLKMLLEHNGIDVNAKDNKGRTPLSYAAREGTLTALNALLEHGAGIDVDVRDNGGRTPLSWAVVRGIGGFRRFNDLDEMVEALIQHGGVDIDAKDNAGRTPLSWAADMAHVSVVRMLLNHGVRVGVNAQDNGGRTPLSWAAEKNHPSVVQLFLQHGLGVDVNAKDAIGRTPLSWAAGRTPPPPWAATGQFSEAALVVKLLLEHGGTEVNARDNRGRTPLSWAAARTDPEKDGVIKALVERGGVGGVP